MAEFKHISAFKELSLDCMHKKMNEFHKKFTILEKVNPQAKEKEDLKSEVLDEIGDLFNELYYVYKDKYNEEKNVLNTKDKNKFDDKKLRLADDYESFSEEEKSQSDKKHDKKQPLKKTNKIDAKVFNELIYKERTDIA